MVSSLSSTCCIYQCKDTNFKANHNNLRAHYEMPTVVFTNAKIPILKQSQLTTLPIYCSKIK